jgi:hypothetical protein
MGSPRDEPQVKVEFSYDRNPPPKDLLSYKDMDIEMGRWASTGTGWMSVIVVLGYTVLCFVLMTVLWWLRTG